MNSWIRVSWPMHSVKFQTGCTNRRVWSCRVETSGLRFFEIREATSQLRDELATVDPCSEEVICRVSSSILRRMKSWSWNQSHAMYTIPVSYTHLTLPTIYSV